MLFSFEFHNAKVSKMPKVLKWSKCKDAKKRCQNKKMIEKWNVNNSGLSVKMECNSKLIVTQSGMSFKMECH